LVFVEKEKLPSCGVNLEGIGIILYLLSEKQNANKAKKISFISYNENPILF
jgi:hypothetical protein